MWRSRLGVKPAELSEVPENREVFRDLPGLLSPQPSREEKPLWKLIDEDERSISAVYRAHSKSHFYHRVSWVSARGTKREIPPWKLGLRTKLSSKHEVIWFNFCNNSLPLTLTLYKSQVYSLFWCLGAMSLQFVHVPSFSCKGKLRNLRAYCSTVVLYCVKTGVYWGGNGVLTTSLIKLLMCRLLFRQCCICPWRVLEFICSVF